MPNRSPNARPWPPTSLDEKLHAVRMVTRHYSKPGTLNSLIIATYDVSITRFWQVMTQQVLTDAEVYAAEPIKTRTLIEASQRSDEEKDVRRRWGREALARAGIVR